MVKKKVFLPKLCINFQTISSNEFVQGQKAGINNMKDRWPKYLTVIELFRYVYKQIGKGWLKKRFFFTKFLKKSTDNLISLFFFTMWSLNSYN